LDLAIKILLSLGEVVPEGFLSPPEYFAFILAHQNKSWRG
jgi:hypothetical protein